MGEPRDRRRVPRRRCRADRARRCWRAAGSCATRKAAMVTPNPSSSRSTRASTAGTSRSPATASTWRRSIVSPAFDGLSRVKRHQLVYAALGDRMREEIHALSMQTLTPAQWARAAESWSRARTPSGAVHTGAAAARGRTRAAHSRSTMDSFALCRHRAKWMHCSAKRCCEIIPASIRVVASQWLLESSVSESCTLCAGQTAWRLRCARRAVRRGRQARAESCRQSHQRAVPVQRQPELRSEQGYAEHSSTSSR